MIPSETTGDGARGARGPGAGAAGSPDTGAGAFSRTAAIRLRARSDPEAASALLRGLLADRFGLAAERIVLLADRYALNSLSGLFEAGGRRYFFKFHQEEGEGAMRGEYYRAQLLDAAGIPVDRPLFVSAEPGEQVLVYARRDGPRLADLLLRLDLARDPAAEASVLAAETGLCAALDAVYARTLRPISPAESAAEPIHRLFHERLTDPAPGGRRYPGGRLAAFYLGQRVALPGAELAWDDFAARRWRINGRAHAETIAALFDAAALRLAPERLADAGGVTAHGDAHAANIWVEPDGRLVLFDPAFAGAAVPSLLAEVKPTFHNVLAHPLWLYDPAEAASRYALRLGLAPGWIEVETDCTPGPLRRALLRVKAERLWRPLLGRLAAAGMLPADWRRVVRLALFLCPTLVVNLRAGEGRRCPAASAIGFAAAVAAGSPAEEGDDLVTAFLDAIDPATPAAAARARADAIAPPSDPLP